jgi:chitin synthase
VSRFDQIPLHTLQELTYDHELTVEADRLDETKMEPQQRPPRSVPPLSAQQQQHARSPLSQQQQQQQQQQPVQGAISFAPNEQGDRAAPLPFERRQQRYSASFDPNAIVALGVNNNDGPKDPEALGAKMSRKKSLVKPDRERIDPSHPQWHYRTHAARMGEQNGSNMAVLPSSKPIAISNI